MNSALITFKTDLNTKKELKIFADQLGLNSSSFVNMLVKQALRDKRIVVSTNLEPTPYLEKLIREADDDYTSGTIMHTDNVDDALVHLDSLMKK